MLSIFQFESFQEILGFLLGCNSIFQSIDVEKGTSVNFNVVQLWKVYRVLMEKVKNLRTLRLRGEKIVEHALLVQEVSTEFSLTIYRHWRKYKSCLKSEHKDTKCMCSSS